MKFNANYTEAVISAIMIEQLVTIITELPSKEISNENRRRKSDKPL